MEKRKKAGSLSEVAIWGSDREFVPVEAGALGMQVNARLLHMCLKSGYQYANWITDRISRYRLKEGRDFLRNSLKSSGGRPAIDHMLSLETAVHIAMVEESEIGFAIREYFIETEKRYRDWTGIWLPKLECENELFSNRLGYNYGQLLLALGISATKRAFHSRIARNRQEFWRNQAKVWYVSDDYGKNIILYALARKGSGMLKQRRLEYENRKALTDVGI
jgi:phage anti-repressor protein